MGRNPKLFSAQNNVISKKKKKKRSSPKFRVIFGPKSKAFFRPKLGDLQKIKKKKKRSSPKFRVIFGPKSKAFFRPKLGDLQKKKKKKKKRKGLHQNCGCYFVQFRKFRRLRGGCFRMGGAIFHFHRKSASEAQKACDFAYFTSQWGGARAPPPPPPWLRY